MKATIRYLSFVSKTPHRLAHFYCTYLGMRELGRSPEGDVSVTDGNYNLTFLLARHGRADPGTGQMGIAVDDIRDLEARIEEYATGAELQPAEGGMHFGEYTVEDPNGYPIAVSTTNFALPAGNSHQLPTLVHTAVCEPDGERVAAFYAKLFGFEEPARGADRNGHFMRDGWTNLAILATGDEMRTRGGRVTPDHGKEGLNHFGFEVPRAEEFVKRFPPEAGATQRLDRPRPEGYFRVWDPDGNHFDLRTTPGWRNE